MTSPSWADSLGKDGAEAEAGAVRVRVVSETDPQVTSMVESIREANGFADPDKNSAADDKLHEFAAEARMVKDAYEVNEMRKAVDATKHGFDRLLSLAAVIRARQAAFRAHPRRRVQRRLPRAGQRRRLRLHRGFRPSCPDPALDATPAW